MHSTNSVLPMDTATQSVPIDIPCLPVHTGRRSSTSNASYQNQHLATRKSGSVHTLGELDTVDYLARSPANAGQLAPTFALTVPESEHGEWNASDLSILTAASGREDTHSPATATSDSCLTLASTAFSEPMSRGNTGDQICESFGMFNMDPALASTSIPDGSMQNMTGTAYSSSFSFPSQLDLSSFPFSDTVPEYQSISFASSMMKPSLSRGSVSSSSTDGSSEFPMSSTVDQSIQAKQPRSIAPKKHDDASRYSLIPKLVAVKGDDGVIKHKAEISRATRQPQQRKTQFCNFCNDQPQGFHGEHELRRHMDRQHTQYRKVWICHDASEDGTFLRNCKACRNNKTYGANYNAAAHLRRTHFNPCKSKRGGRGKKSEGRGGMGGGNSPSMEELKKWMFETYEMNLNGRTIVQPMPTDAALPQVPMAELAEFDQSMQMVEDVNATGFHSTQMYGHTY